nr:PREDICTED: cohesin subunit SA-1-like [Latimeria chalumnae]|eukprot:XP_014339767.1 PREDICTED: cohesin subunit SA-1-like [Latimeria chalumnae]
MSREGGSKGVRGCGNGCYLDLLLKQIQEIVNKHTEADALEACAKALYVLCDDEYTFYNRVDFARTQLVEVLVDRFNQNVNDLLQLLLRVLSTCALVSSAHNLQRWELFHTCHQLLKKGIDTGEIPEEVMVPALNCSYFSVLWDLDRVSNTMPSKETMMQVKQRLKGFGTVCQSCLTNVNTSVREQAFVLLSDFLVIFSHQMVKSGRDFLLPLIYQPDCSLELELASFVMDHVFVDLDDGEGGEGMCKPTVLQSGQIKTNKTFVF